MKTFPKNDPAMKWVATCLLFLLSFQLMAQESVLSASNNATGTGGTVSYSVGQVAYNTNTGTTGTTMEGVQQPYEILFLDGIEAGRGISLECIVYPNPASACVKLKIENYRTIGVTLNCRLTNMNGLLLRDMNISGDETIIPADDLAPATYLLTIFGDGIAWQTYKIIKK
jgi:hypothetical protein